MLSPAELSWLTDAIGDAETALANVVGRPGSCWKSCTFSPEELFRRLAARLRHQTGNGVILNTSAVTPRPVGDVLTRRDLVELVPYDNRALCAGPSPACDPRTLGELEARFGPLVIEVPRRDALLITTDYLGQQFPATRPYPARLSQLVLAELERDRPAPRPWKARASP
ncbi:hypothetical protein [Streptomyces sp. NPDC047453]|uniref:hypothetical protein n=1 Tax=Streptomyces sp. NPDC047453 TaxID=3154812 RepID=UPI0033C7E5AB